MPLWCVWGCGLVPQLTFDESTLGVFATVAIRISCRVDSLKADARSRFSTWNRGTMAPPSSLFLTFLSSTRLGVGIGKGYSMFRGTRYPAGSRVGWCKPGRIYSWHSLLAPLRASPLIFLYCRLRCVTQGTCGLSRD